MSEYTPSTETIRSDYAHVTSFGLDLTNLRYEEFDRWLAEVKAQAWDEGYSEDSGFLGNNPYRGENK